VYRRSLATLCIIAASSLVGALDPVLQAQAKDEKKKGATVEVVLPPLPGPVGDPTKAKILMALLYDKSCYTACQKVRPVLLEIANERVPEVAYLEIDLSNYTAAVKLAKQYGVGAIIRDSSDEVPLLEYFDERRVPLEQESGAKTKDVYLRKLQHCLDKVNQKKS
jgi:hypothetical protein